MRKIVFILLFFLSLGLKARDIINFNEGWKFSVGDIKGAEKAYFKDASWRVLDLPHDWSIEGDYDINNPMGGQCGYLPAGFGWYRKTIRVPKEWKGKHVEIAFDGVYMNSTVWANGQQLGVRPYGWISFSYDISEIAKDSETITFAVRVDNDKQPSARWYTGSGIYANTWIKVKELIHIPTSGVFVKTKGNSISVETELSNVSDENQRLKIVSCVYDANGKRVVEEDHKFRLKKHALDTIHQELIIENPNKWSVETPNLYTLVSEVYIGKSLVDKVETKFGMRDIEWKPKTGMWINGKNVKLQGVCNHQDAGALGAAVPDKILKYRIQQLKNMGCNAIRTAHNPQTPQFYDMCDEMGMLVMDEIFDGWMKKAANDYGAHAFQDWWKRDLSDWIKRDRNHASVVIYSVGNETHGEVGADLVKTCHELDATRPVTSGHSGSEYMDVFGVNGSSEKMGWFDTLESDRVFIGTENTHTWQVRGFYRTKTWYRDGYPNKRQQPYQYPDLTEKEVFTYDWTGASGKQNYKQIFNSSYDNAMVRLTSRQNIEQLRDIPNYAGSFRWTGHDYIGEATYVHGGWPFKSFMGGAIDMANFEKDLYYLYQSQWTKTPMLHVFPHWTHPTMKLGTEIPIWTYTNYEELELFLNDVSLGRKKPGSKWSEMACQWLVPWQPGELRIVAYEDGINVKEKRIKTASHPSKIALSIDGESLSNEKNDVVQVRVTTTDSNGNFYPYGENRTAFSVIGNGKIRALDNGSPIDVEKHYEAKDRIAFFGLTRAYVESTSNIGGITLLASSILGEKRQVSSNMVSIDVQTIGLRGVKAEGKLKVYYTIDGSRPNMKSLEYNKPFRVEVGTVVKAIVVYGSAVQYLEESFEKEEGFVWDAKALAAVPGGDQAEDAAYNDAIVSSKGKGFTGKGYVDFGRNSGGYIEWYQENDGSEGEFELEIRYSALNKIRNEYKVLLSINDQSKEIKLPATAKYRTEWGVFKVKVNLGKGANTIRITALEDDGLSIDALKVN